MMQADPSARFPDLRPITSDPPLFHLWGFGLYLYGERDFDPPTESFVRTVCFCLLYIPIVAWRAYRVAPTDDGWRILGRVPVSPASRVLGVLASLSVLGGSSYLAFMAYWNSPGVVASRNLAAADRLEAEGHAEQAAPLLGIVAEGPTAKARAAQDRLDKMIGADGKLEDGARRAALLEAVRLQRGGHWRGPVASLRERAVALARKSVASAPATSWETLEAVAPLGAASPSEAGLRRDLLERLAAADPSNVNWASLLAVDCESRGELERAEKLLAPHRARLGEFEGARVLALCDARANRLNEAISLLRAYTGDRLKRLAQAEERYRSLSTNFQKNLIRRLETEHVPDFPYDAYRYANKSRQQEVAIQYLEQKVKGDPGIQKAEQGVIAESHVVPAALELGLALMQHAQAQADVTARKSLLDEAGATFLAISRMVGDRVDFQLNLAQVYYWQGKHGEGRAIVDKVLKDHNRAPEWLLRVADLLRHVGSDSDSRKLALECYEKAPPGELKNHSATLVGILSSDIEERIRWMSLSNSNEPYSKAMLLDDQATQALEKGDEQQAIARLKEAAAIYRAMPESPGVLNNAWIVTSRLARLTGDPDALQQANALIAKAAALDPGNSLTLHNAAESLLESSLRELIGPSIDLNLLRSPASVDLIGFLTQDASQDEEYLRRLRNSPAVNRARSMLEKVVLLAPQNPASYRSLTRLLDHRRDAEGLRKLLSSLEHTELDLNDETKIARENESGQRDASNKVLSESALKLVEVRLPVARAKGGATFAVAASVVNGARIAASAYDVKADENAIVTLAEEAFSGAPSLASRWSLISAHLFRAIQRLAAADSRFASLRKRSSRSVSINELFGVVLSIEGPLKQVAMKDPDVDRALDLLHESFTACPTYSAGPLTWSLLQAKYPADAAAVARTHGNHEADHLYEAVRARLAPYDRTATLKAFWRARMENRERDALQIRQNASSNGFPVPVATP